MEDSNYEAKKALEIAGLENTIQMQKEVSSEIVVVDHHQYWQHLLLIYQLQC